MSSRENWVCCILLENFLQLLEHLRGTRAIPRISTYFLGKHRERISLKASLNPPSSLRLLHPRLQLVNLHLLSLALGLHFLNLRLQSFSKGPQKAVSYNIPPMYVFVGMSRAAYISLSINSNLPFTAMTASERSCFSSTGPTSL